MNQQVFQSLWDIQLRSQFEDRAASLFLEPGKSSRILLSRCCPIVADIATPSSESNGSEKTEVSDGIHCDVQRIDEGFEIVSEANELERHKKQCCATRLWSLERVGNSWSPLALTRELFDDLCYDMKISNALRNLISHMGKRDMDERAAPLPYWRTVPDDTGKDAMEMCYALRYVAENKSGSTTNPWSIRQFAVHSRTEKDDLHSSWLFVALPRDWFCDAVSMSKQSRGDLGECASPLHMLVLQQSLACWRPYLSYLDKEVAKCDREVSFASPSGKLRDELPQILLKMRNLENQVENARISLLGNERVVHAHEFLSGISTRFGEEVFGESRARQCEVYLARQHIEMILLQLESLKTKLTSCTEIASSFLLQNIASTSAQEATKSRRDAATVKALTVVASVFLPTTLVMNFFSTSFVESKSDSIVVLKDWWLLLAIGLPLTCLVFLTWAVYSHFRTQSLVETGLDAGNAC